MNLCPLRATQGGLGRTSEWDPFRSWFVTEGLKIVKGSYERVVLQRRAEYGGGRERQRGGQQEQERQKSGEGRRGGRSRRRGESSRFVLFCCGGLELQ